MAPSRNQCRKVLLTGFKCSTFYRRRKRELRKLQDEGQGSTPLATTFEEQHRTTEEINMECVDQEQDISMFEDRDGQFRSNSDIEALAVENRNIDSQQLECEDLNQPLVPFLTVTKFEALLSVLHLALRHLVTKSLLEDILKLINELLGSHLITSHYLFNKLFFMDNMQLWIHFYCSTCHLYLGSNKTLPKNTATVVCGVCKEQRNVCSLGKGNYFITLSVKEQLKNILETPGIKIMDHQNLERNLISDIHHGQIYASLFQGQGGPISDKNALTLTFGSDGSPVFSSSKNSLWPVQLICNNIDPKQRFEKSNVMLAGLWFGEKEPDMALFLKPFVEEMADLTANGITWTNASGLLVKSQVFALCCICDSVAKPKIQNMKQFNGTDGCGYCYNPTYRVPGTKQRRYDAQHYRCRTDIEMHADMKKAEKTGTIVRGLKGLSPLTFIPNFSIVFGFGIDYMHAVLLGVMRQLACLWFDTPHNNNFPHNKTPFYIGNHVDKVDDILCAIKPPSNISRRPRQISRRAHWKATEWRNFLLYFGLPCLKNILPLRYYSHFRKLVSSIYILLQDTITLQEVKKAEDLLQDFVSQFSDMYGELQMVYNVHLLTHLAESVRKLGPLWAFSAFTFESGNGHLLRLVKGTNGVLTQISKKYVMCSALNSLISKYRTSDKILKFCHDIVDYKETKNVEKVADITLLGFSGMHTLNSEEQIAVEAAGLQPMQTAIYYNRVIRNGLVYCGNMHSKQKKFDDSCVKFLDGTYAILKLIVMLRDKNEVWCLNQPINTASDQGLMLPLHIKQCSFYALGQPRFSPFPLISTKCIFIACEENMFISEFPNLYERD